MSQSLIIDDNKLNVDILSRFLEEEGVATTQLTNPRNLEDILETIDDLTIIFLDLEMPYLDGFEVLEKIRSYERFNSVPVIAHSVHISEIKVTHEAGFDGFIGKPLNADKFKAQLARILSGKSVWETA